MSVSNTPRKAGPYTGNNTDVHFVFGFKVFATSDLVATRATIATGAESTLALTTDYTVTLNADQDNDPGGYITLTAALASTYTLTLTSAVPDTQPSVFTNLGGFFPAVLNNALDRLTILVQQLKETVGRSLKLAVSTPTGFDAQLPAPVPYGVVGFNADGTGFAVTDPSGSSALAGDLATAATGKGADKVALLPAGSGAVATTVTAKLRQAPLRTAFDKGLDTVIFDGDSITAGTVISLHKFSDDFKALAYSDGALNVPNFAQGGAWIPAGSNGGNNITDRYAANVKPLRPTANGGSGKAIVYLHILIGTNDLSPAYGNMSAATVISNLTSYVTTAQADGFTVVLGTIMPRADAFGWTAAAEVGRLAVNAAIKNGTIPADLVVDYASALTGVGDTNLFVDRIHPTVLGSKVMAARLNQVLMSGVSDKVNVGDGFGSLTFSGLLQSDWRAYAQFGKAYMQTSIGSNNGNSTGFLILTDLNEGTADVKNWQFQMGVTGSGLRLQALNDANTTVYDMWHWSRTGLNAGYKSEFRGVVQPADVTGWFQAGLAGTAQRAGVGDPSGSGSGLVWVQNLQSTGVAADESQWHLSVTTNSNELALRCVNDAVNANNIAWSVTRTGYVPSAFVINAVARPRTDNVYTLGAASYRWSTVYAATGAINTSDGTQKQDIATLTAAEHAVAVALKSLVRTFRFKDAVAAKGNAARVHVGVIAQDVAAAFAAQGLDPAHYGMFCSDTWLDDQGRTVTRLGIRYEELLAFIIAAL